MAKKGESVLDELGGTAWLRAFELRTDDRAGSGQSALALKRVEDRKGKPNRVIITRQKEGKQYVGYKMEYWRVDDEDADAMAEKLFSTTEEVKTELIESFGATAPAIVMEW